MAAIGSNEKIVLTDEEVIEVGALAAYLSMEQIADYFGIVRGTFYKIMERQPDVAEQYKKGRARTIQSAAKSLIMQGHEGNTAALMFYLKTQAGWKETQVTEHAGGISITEIKNTIVDPLSSK
jgi:hypothetical protein